jgi:putative ABC transport system permease protein
MRRFWELFLLALGNLRRRPMRLTLTATGIAIATGALVSMVGFALGLQAKVEEPFLQLELFNRIDVLPATAPQHAGSSASPDPPPLLDLTTLDRIASLSGVAVAYPDYRLDALELVRGDKRLTTSALSLPGEAGELSFVRDSILAGRFLNGPAEVVVGKQLVRKLGFSAPAEAVGQTIDLEAKGLTSTGDGKLRPERRKLVMTIAGVWDPPSGRNGFAADGVVLPVQTIKDLPGIQFQSLLERLFQGSKTPPGSFGRVVVRVRHASDLLEVERNIQKLGLQTQTLLGQFKQLRTGFILMDLVLTAVGSVALVVAGLGIINTQLMAVLERYREIGTYKALGASNGDVRCLFLLEAVLIGLLGGAGGLLLGRVVSWIIELGVNTAASRYGVEQPPMVFAFPFRLLGGALLFALVVSVISGLYPASRATRVDPIQALRAD